MIKNPSIIAVYKPKGPTSHDIIFQMRKLTKEKRIGHAGTLDPLASGVLVVAIGREATRQIQNFVEKEKEYIAEITLGITSTTDDEEGIKTRHSVPVVPARETVEKVIQNFIGKISQTAPIYSALKVQGKPMYQYARNNLEVTPKERIVEIKNIKIIEFNYPKIIIQVTTGPGVYIRSLARDIGEKLHTGGYLSSLERTRVGSFTKEQAMILSQS